MIGATGQRVRSARARMRLPLDRMIGYAPTPATAAVVHVRPLNARRKSVGASNRREGASEASSTPKKTTDICTASA